MHSSRHLHLSAGCRCISIFPSPLLPSLTKEGLFSHYIRLGLGRGGRLVSLWSEFCISALLLLSLVWLNLCSLLEGEWMDFSWMHLSSSVKYHQYLIIAIILTISHVYCQDYTSIQDIWQHDRSWSAQSHIRSREIFTNIILSNSSLSLPGQEWICYDFPRKPCGAVGEKMEKLKQCTASVGLLVMRISDLAFWIFERVFCFSCVCMLV